MKVTSNALKLNNKKHASHPTRSTALVELPWHSVARTVISTSRMTLLIGEPGCGKTEAGQHFLTQFNGHEPVVLNGTPETERQDFLGTFLLVGGESQFSDFSLTRALRECRSLLINELGQVPVETLVTLLPLRDGRSTYSHPITSEDIPVPDDFRIVATANPQSLEMSCRRATESAKAILEGFSIIEVPVPTTEQLQAIVHSHLPDADSDLISSGLAHWEMYRGIKQERSVSGLSVRSILEYVRLRTGGLKDSSATRIAFVNKFIYDSDLHSSAALRWSMNTSGDQ